MDETLKKHIASAANSSMQMQNNISDNSSKHL